jgi:hypothetical protein
MAILIDPWLWLFLVVSAGMVTAFVVSLGPADFPTWAGLVAGLLPSLVAPVPASGDSLGAALDPSAAARRWSAETMSVLERVRPVQPGCQVVLGFALLEAYVGPSVVGACLEPERFDPSTATSEQRTSRGLLVWRKTEGVLAFTDGHHTWLLGPDGLQQRLNAQRYCWEAGANPAACLRSSLRPPLAR